MSTKQTKHWWHIPRTYAGIHIYRDILDGETYIAIGNWNHELTFAWPRIWRRLESPSRTGVDDGTRIWRQHIRRGTGRWR